MKKTICCAITMALGLALPQILVAQACLTGTWRLKESKKVKGPDYTNAVPLIINIQQKPDVMIFKITSDNGEQETVLEESLAYGQKSNIEGRTAMGRKKLISFKMNQDSSWLKQTEIFTKDDLTKRHSIDKETFSVYNHGAGLAFFREYDGNDDPNGNEDFTVEAVYERVTSEQLSKETAKGMGVNFIEGLNWEQIKSKAKKENKYIFVDCYATWCRPCKMMDRYVYPLNIVGEAMNDRFVAVKVQMDTTKKDGTSVKMLYSLARQLESEYGIEALPSYLFFSPDGIAVHKAVGQQDAKKFIGLLGNVRKPEQQLYTLFSKAKNKELPWSEYPVLARKLKDEFGEKELSKEVAVLYKNEYLNKLSEKDLLTKSNLDFVSEYSRIVKSSDKLFQMSLRKPNLIDSIKQSDGNGWAEALVKKTIVREELEPLLDEAEKFNKEPNWIKLEQQLSEKYNNELKSTFVLDARVDWYEKKKDWVSFLRYVKPHLDQHGVSSIKDLRHINNCAWYVFKYSTDIDLMQEALGWIDSALGRWTNQFTLADGPMDTKASLLYKMGRKKEAIELEGKILTMFPQFRYAYQPTLDKMLKGEKIWLEQD